MNASPSSLVLRRGSGAWAGLRTLFAKENASWWRTRKWWIMCLGWLALLNGSLALNMAGGGASAFSTFVQMAAIVLPIGAISLAQDSIFRERHAGTAAWVLTKPLARPAFVLGKTAATGLGFFITAVALPALAAWLQLTLVARAHFALSGYLGVVGLIYLNIFFYLALTMMLTTLFDSRGPVLAIALGLVFGWLFIQSLIEAHAAWLVQIMPWNLVLQVGSRQPLAAYLLMGKPLPSVMPLVGTAVWSALFLAVAVLRFRREEF